MTALILTLILGITFLLAILVYMIINGFQTLKRTREIAQAKKCPYKIEGGQYMPRTHRKITISIPVELDSLIDTLVKESKKSARPMNKSNFIATMCYSYLEETIKLLDSRKIPEKEEKK